MNFWLLQGFMHIRHTYINHSLNNTRQSHEIYDLITDVHTSAYTACQKVSASCVIAGQEEAWSSFRRLRENSIRRRFALNIDAILFYRCPKKFGENLEKIVTISFVEEKGEKNVRCMSVLHACCTCVCIYVYIYIHMCVYVCLYKRVNFVKAFKDIVSSARCIPCATLSWIDAHFSIFVR